MRTRFQIHEISTNKGMEKDHVTFFSFKNIYVTRTNFGVKQILDIN